MHSGGNGQFLRVRTAVLGLSKAIFLGLATAAPLQTRDHHDNAPEAEGGALWILYVVSMVLVLLGGAFAGLTIALMGQDEVYLQVISLDPDEPQRKSAKRVLDLLNKGKHWVLVTLLLSNVIVNETLPVVLDRCFGGGVAAVIGSTALIVIFGEIVPQSICVRYGLPIGGFMSKPVLILMWLMAPIAWPTAKLLDYLLGKDHGTVYKKSGLKTLVSLHKSLGEVDERLNQDEVTIITAVLDLKRKTVESVMTPMDDVFTMAEDTVLDQDTIDNILDAGYSRIPIHQAGNETNFVGMLLVKILITYDPEDGKRVKDFPLATLPETGPETSCLDIINYFQEGKSHMVLISEAPGTENGAIGVVTLEDVIEELIGEEIIDESDVYVDVHRAIRRSHPAPKARTNRKDAMVKESSNKDTSLLDLVENDDGGRIWQRRTSSHNGKLESALLSSSPKMTTLLMRRSSAGQDGQLVHTTVPVKANREEIRDHFKHLGPSNKASNPKSTRVSAIKIKPGAPAGVGDPQRTGSVATAAIPEEAETGVDERTSLLRPPLTGKDGIQALHRSYNGTTSGDLGTSPQKSTVKANGDTPEPKAGNAEVRPDTTESAEAEDALSALTWNEEIDALGRRRGYVRSGSITENVIEAGGIRKVVLETNSSSDTEEEEEEEAEEPSPTGKAPSEGSVGASNAAQSNGDKKNRRRKRRGTRGGKDGAP